MDISDLSSTEQNSLRRALAYWVLHWDWECPTLFGLEKAEFQALLDAWPQCLALQEKIAALAIVGALREMLHGASAVNRNSVTSLVGLSYTEACALLDRLLPRIDQCLDNENAV
ncbi:MAG: hypothetical protein ABL855_06735 [Sideroxydans sp.]